MKRFKPEVVYSEDRCWGEWITSSEAKLVADKTGEWVKHETAVNIQRQGAARAARLEKALIKVSKELNDLKIKVFFGECCQPNKSNEG